MPFARTIREPQQIRVAYPFAHFAKGWGIARSATALLILGAAAALPAQTAPCGITSITETSRLIYPPIARAAHASGDVILLTRFDTHGVPVDVAVVSGPPMLQGAAVDFVKGWRANGYTGPRECPIVVSFKMIEDDKSICTAKEDGLLKLARSDVQHVSVAVHSLCGLLVQPSTSSVNAAA